MRSNNRSGTRCSVKRLFLWMNAFTAFETAKYHLNFSIKKAGICPLLLGVWSDYLVPRNMYPFKGSKSDPLTVMI